MIVDLLKVAQNLKRGSFTAGMSYHKNKALALFINRKILDYLYI